MTTAPLSESQREDEEETSVSQEMQAEAIEPQGVLIWNHWYQIINFAMILLCSSIARHYHCSFISLLTDLSEFPVSEQSSYSHDIGVGPGTIPGAGPVPGTDPIPGADPVPLSCDTISDGMTSKYMQHLNDWFSRF